MKVLDLQCQQQHEFEGWFSSEADFQTQLARQFIQCPICASCDISKRLSAPHLSLSSAREILPASREAKPPQGTRTAEMQAVWLKMVRHILDHTVDVGENFAAQARKIYHGQAEHVPIRGQVTADETQELLEEGIPILPLHIPEPLKGTLQ